MRLNKVEIHNFKGIENCQLHFHDKMNLIIGGNGIGKTSILEAIAVGLGGAISGLNQVSTRNFKQDEIRIQYEKIGDGSYNQKYITPVEVSCQAEFNGKEYEWKRTREAFNSSLNNSRTTMQPKQIAQDANQLANEDSAILPLINYQSVARTWMQKLDAKESSVVTKLLRTSGYRDCLSAVPRKKQIIAWCAKMEQISWQKGHPIGEYEGAKATVSKFMSLIEENHHCEIFYEKQSEELLYVKDGTAEAISSLSAGYQSLIWMVFDIAYRMALLNPFLRDRVSETPGIVLIDEPDTHLHPEWQWLLMGALQQVFPNIQFIVASHAPVVIASVKKGQIIDISSIEDIIYREPEYGLDINDTLCQVFESVDMPEEVAALQKKFYEAIDLGDMDSAKQIVTEIETLIGNKPIAVEARTTYELETALGD